MRKLRDWQVDALDKIRLHPVASFLLECTPGGGKTAFAAQCARYWHENDIATFTIFVVPTVVIKGDQSGGFLYECHQEGFEIITVLKDGRDIPRAFRGAAITYSQLPNLVGTIETWKCQGVRLGLVFDEVHHLTENNVWGSSAERISRSAVKVLSMTGTLFRGDGAQISFVNYVVNEEGIPLAKPDYSYVYRNAVTDRVCRPVQFLTEDGVAEYMQDERENEVRLSESKDRQAPLAAAAAFKKGSQWLDNVIYRADEMLSEYRITDSDAGGLVVCRPGTDDNDDRHLHQVAKAIAKALGDAPEVITHDDTDANAKIERFRHGNARWICAVRKISEGVDIKRLRVLVLLNYTSTELLFRQIVGRILRVDNDTRVDYATAFIAKFPRLEEWAKRFSDEAEVGLRDLEKTKLAEPRDRASPANTFLPLGATYEEGGAISDYGEQFSSAEINAAERDKRNDPEIADLPVTKLAHLRRKYGLPSLADEPVMEPLQVQKKRLRIQINNLVRQSVFKTKSSPTSDDYKDAFVSVLARVSAKNLDDLVDNFSLDVMQQVCDLAKRMARSSDD